MICEALDKHRCLRPGKKGLGFGVGTEQLISVFASMGASIVATDQAPDDESMAWDNGQLAHGKESLYYPKIIDRKSFDELVSFQHHDMNKYDPSFKDAFDFCWSNCVIGHVGSMKKSELYLKRHAKYLKYGGISVFTTELNISSHTKTVDRDSGTIIWRLSDLLRVFTEMLEEDMVADRLKLRLRRDKSDTYIYYDIDLIGCDVTEFHKLPTNVFITKIPFNNYAITQIQVIFKKQRVSAPRKKLLSRLYQYDYKQNMKKLTRFMQSPGDITDYSVNYLSSDYEIMPARKTVTISGKAGATAELKLKYINNSQECFFSYGFHTPLNVPPLVLATAGPVNRTSSLKTKTWFSPNRPSVTFKPMYKKADFPDHCHGYHRVFPGESFSYTFTIRLPKKPGTHTEKFCLVLEGFGDIPSSVVSLIVKST